MKIAVFGIGYVGLVQAAMLSHYGHDVICIDIDTKKIENLINGEIPIHEPGLAELVESGIANNNLTFTTNSEHGVNYSDVIFIAVGTPSDKDGSADLKYVLAVAETIAEFQVGCKTIVTKSTVPVGTGDRVQSAIKEKHSLLNKSEEYYVVSNPEFLREGSAVKDCLYPERIVVGTDSDKAVSVMRKIYSSHINEGVAFLAMDRRSAELTKYVANSFLATKISFMNEMANIAEKFGANIELVKDGIGLDPRIGNIFMNPGCGYGGSCFPKDVRALINSSIQIGHDAKILHAVNLVNLEQKKVLSNKVLARFQDLSKLKIAVWGLAFKPNTDDVREAPSIDLIACLLEQGAIVHLYDPVAIEEFKKVFPDDISNIVYFSDKNTAIEGCSAVVICTEWDEFTNVDFEKMSRSMKLPIIFDGRNIYSPSELEVSGFEYYSIGR